MLSILIPVYNFNIKNLVISLHQQCQEAAIIFEIVCFDDGSESTFKQQNQEIQSLSAVRYKELAQNVGRSKIRNLLADAAQYDYLLFMDCDSKIVRENYIQEYLKHLSPNSLLYGGRIYSPDSPSEKSFYLHWLYGTKRESIPQEKRTKQAYRSFMTNNFLIPAFIFKSVRFEESLTQYGHEDTLFGLQLQQKGIPVIHLDNPIEHIGLETAHEFLEKQKKAVQNLYTLYQKNGFTNTKLLQTYLFLKKFKLLFLFKILHSIFKKTAIKQLKSSSPKLRWLDFFKLGVFIDH